MSLMSLKSSSGGSNPALEGQIQPWRLKSSPGGLNPALEAQIQPWSLKSSPGASNPALEPQHVLEAIPTLADKQSLSEADEEAVKKAVDTLFDAFGQIDEKVHGDGEPSYTPYAEKIESAIGTLQSFAPQQ